MEFKRSSRSNDNGLCVEVAIKPAQSAHVRDSKDREGPVLAFSPEAWRGFLNGLKAN